MKTTEPNYEDEKPPQSLGYPIWQRIEEQEDGSLREEITIRLVLQLAQGEIIVVDLEGAGEEARRVRH